MNSEKTKKNLFLPTWVCEVLDKEGERVGGPGLIAGAAIMAFCSSSPKDRAEMIEKYHKREISEAYGLTEKPKKGGKMSRVVKNAKKRADQARRDCPVRK